MQADHALSRPGPLDSGRVVLVDAHDFEDAAMKSPVPVLLEFGTTWCPPCRALEPVLELLAARHAGALRILRIDGDTSPELAARFAVRGFPTVIALRGGEETGRHVGMAQERTLRALAGI